MKWLWSKALCLIFFVFILNSCNNEKPAPSDGPEREGENQPDSLFHQRKALTFGDSLNIRVLTWGGEEKGSYLVLFADSAGGHYPGNSFYRSGRLKEAWVSDLDNDSLPEIGVVLQEQSGQKFTSLKLHELTKGFDFQTIVMPPLNEAMGSDYGGFDTLYLKGQDVVREFSLLNRADSALENTARRLIIYHFENNQLVPGETKDLPARK